MSKYQYTDKCREISGFSGSYEKACKKMVIAGIEYLDNNKHIDQFNIKEYEFEIQKEMCDSIDNESTFAMIHTCYNHVRYIQLHGWQSYIKGMESN